MLFIKGIYLLLSHLPTSHTTGGCLHHRIAPTAQYTAIGEKPPKSGCICQHIPRFAISRRRATALFRNPVRKAQRSVPGFSSTPTSACRRYATSPPSAVASPIVHHHHQIAHPHRPPSIYMRFGDALLRRPRKRSRLQLTPDRVGGTRTDAYAPRSAAAERSIAKCRKLGRR